MRGLGLSAAVWAGLVGAALAQGPSAPIAAPVAAAPVELPANLPATIPGAATPEFRAAITLWLDDAEAEGLAALRDLAHRGNAAARLWLALVDKTPSLQGPALARIARADRIMLLRQPGGMSGRSWLHSLADLPLGQTWLDLLDTGAGPEVVAAFADLGEARAAREAFLTLAAREHPALGDLPPQDAPLELRYLLWRGADTARQAQISATVPADHPQRGFMDHAGPDPQALADWLASAPVASPLAALCARVCPDSQSACLLSAYQALGSHGALMTLGSPVESIIAQDIFVASARGQSAIVRRILLSVDARGRRIMLARTAQEQQCLAGALDAENQRYRYQRNGVSTPATPN